MTKAAKVRADPDYPKLVEAIAEGQTLKAMAWAREIRKRVGIPASEVYALAKEES